MDRELDRYARQRRLPEVGDGGQERLARASLTVAGRDGATTEAAYLCRAGVGRLALAPGAAPESFAHASAFRHDAARRIGAAAWRALAKIRRELGVERA